jgi:hypothetical protein
MTDEDPSIETKTMLHVMAFRLDSVMGCAVFDLTTPFYKVWEWANNVCRIKTIEPEIVYLQVNIADGPGSKRIDERIPSELAERSKT